MILHSKQHPPVGDALKKLFFSILFSGYLALSLVRFVWPAHLLTSFILSAAGMVAFALLSTDTLKNNLKAYIFVSILILSFLISSIFVGRTERIGHVVVFILTNTGIALILVKGYASRLSVYLIFYGLSVYFIFLILTGVSAGDALAATSYNGISMMMLTACVSLYIVLNMEPGRIDLKPALLTSLICIWAIGRSGIISSLFLLLGLLFLSIRARVIYRYIYFLGVIVLLIFGYLFFGYISTFSEHNIIFENAIKTYSVRSATVESPRLIMWANYFGNLDLFRIIFGANIFVDPWPEGEELAYNYHNSFIMLHSQTGFMGLAILFLVARSLFRYWKINRVFFILFFTVIIRWSTDAGLFFESWDFLVYFFIFYYLYGRAGLSASAVKCGAR